jgi:hypothetical protein
VGGGTSGSKASDAEKKAAKDLHDQANAEREAAGRDLAYGNAYASADRWDDAFRHWGYAAEGYGNAAAHDAEGAAHGAAGAVLSAVGL